MSIETKVDSQNARMNLNKNSSSRSNSNWNSEKKSTKNLATKDATEVLIAGIPFRVKTTRDLETVQELVELVDLKVRHALSLTKSGSIQSAAILAALNLAEELILLKREARKELDKIESKVVRISRDLEEILEK